MEAAALIFSQIGAAAGAGTASAAMTGAALVGTAVTTAAQVVALNSQASADMRAAEIEMENSRRTIAAGRVSAQDNDFETAALLSQVTAAQGASGLSINSGSFQARRQRLRSIGRTSSLRIVNDAQVQAYNSGQRAVDYEQSAKSKKKQRLFTLGEGIFKAGGDLISGAALDARVAARGTNRQARGI